MYICTYKIGMRIMTLVVSFPVRLQLAADAKMGSAVLLAEWGREL